MSVHALIKHSIAKWEKLSQIEENKFPNLCEHFTARATCSLCVTFYYTTYVNCEKCPIALKTGEPGCGGTSIADIENSMDGSNFDDFQRQAFQEVEFLKQVLQDTEEREVENTEEILQRTDASIKEMFVAMEEEPEPDEDSDLPTTNEALPSTQH